MDKRFVQELVNREVIVAAEVGEMLGVTRQQINKLVKSGELTPVKSTSVGDLFLKMEINEYIAKKIKSNADKRAVIIGHGITTKTTEYLMNMENRKDIVGVFIYFNRYDAIKDGFFSIREKRMPDTLIVIDAPTFVVRLSNMEEYMFDGYNCGYNGQGPQGAYRFLTNELHIPDKEVELIFCSRYIKFYKDGEQWKVIKEEIKTESEIERNIEESNAKGDFYLYNDNLVMAQQRISRSLIEKKSDPLGFLNKYFSFVPNPVKVTIYSLEAARKTGHHICSTVGERTYQIIIKDESGKELWLDNYVDEHISITRQNCITSILNALDINVDEYKGRKSLPAFLQKIIGLNLIVENYLEFYIEKK